MSKPGKMCVINTVFTYVLGSILAIGLFSIVYQLHKIQMQALRMAVVVHP